MSRRELTLDQGHKLAVEAGVEDPEIRDAVWELLIEACETLRRLPDREKGWLRSCDRSTWPVYVRGVVEDWVIQMERMAVKDPELYGGRVQVRKDLPTNAAIDRLDEVMGWLSAVGSRNKRRRDVQVLMALASGIKRSRICRMAGGIKRQTLYDIRERALAAIIIWFDNHG